MNNLLFLRERTLPKWHTVAQTTHKMQYDHWYKHAASVNGAFVQINQSDDKESVALLTIRGRLVAEEYLSAVASDADQYAASDAAHVRVSIKRADAMHNPVCNSASLSIIKNKMLPLIRFTVESSESVIGWSKEVTN